MNRLSAAHLNDEQLMDAYYGEFDASGHLTVCDECRGRFDRLRDVLDSFREYPIPERDPGYATAVWSKLLPKLPKDRPQRWWLQWWTWTPALAALLIITFVAGRLTERNSQAHGISEKARERVLLISLSDYLEQSQIVLANVENAAPGTADLAGERDRAHELLGANRLLRQAAEHLGDYADAALLDELERVLLDVANSPAHDSAANLDQLQQRIEREGLLFRVRITSTASRERGQKL
ncbi:MAG TPA: hypothetical protein VHZ07_05970 [Bryobacteraceae bacterium]|nr:hypothetical protein [Bryobacteraceae bacterium]